MKFSYIWFDIGYTLLHMKREETYREALRCFGEEVTIETLEKEFHWVDKLFMREYPGVFLNERSTVMPWFLGILNHRLGLKLDLYKVDACWEKIQNTTENYWTPFDNVHSVLTELREKSLHMGVISNWDYTARDLLGQYGLSEYFDHCIISSEIGISKPDPEIFNTAMKKAAVKPHECLYVGDNYYDDAVGGLKAGMQVLIINRFDKLGIEEIDSVPIIQNLGQIKAFL